MSCGVICAKVFVEFVRCFIEAGDQLPKIILNSARCAISANSAITVCLNTASTTSSPIHRSPYTATVSMPGDRDRRVGLQAGDVVAAYRRSPRGSPPQPSPSSSN